ncbi:Hypothetical predicted protein [Lecanosticta acicola]|uniref:Uncharacterized protein n=1 Tax=Lecanosticta acicola TaxID=111012 RepID=A0AAI8Z5P5_9PEZI|nr:Hypothetical predicted protein [Lecanosticta acicola]
MATIKIGGLSEQQVAALDGVALGDMIFIQKLAPPPQYDSESEDDDEDAEGVDEEDEEDGEETGEEDEEEYNEEYNEEYDEEYDEDEAEDDDTDENEQQEANNSDVYPSEEDWDVPPRMFVVSRLTQDDLGSITRIQLSLLNYSPKVTPNDAHLYHIYGKSCVHHHPSKCGSSVTACNTVADLVDIVKDSNFLLHVKPDGDSVRRLDSAVYTTNGSAHGQCIAGCKRGWLANVSMLQGMIKDYDPLTTIAAMATGGTIPRSFQQTVCPCCIGSDLVQEQQSLQAATMQGTPPVIDDILAFYGKLNARRRQLGFRFRQFDERQWGYHFDDLESGSDGGGNNGNGQWEHWDEANDPNANFQTRPASEKAIAALPRMALKEVKAEKPDYDDTCNIGTEDLEDDSVMTEVAEVDGEDAAEAPVEDSAPEMDGDDVVMSDVE